MAVFVLIAIYSLRASGEHEGEHEVQSAESRSRPAPREANIVALPYHVPDVQIDSWDLRIQMEESCLWLCVWNVLTAKVNFLERNSFFLISVNVQDPGVDKAQAAAHQPCRNLETFS